MKAVDRRHLRDDQMIAVFAGARSRLRHPEDAVEHLQTCIRCADRYAAVVERIADWRDDAVAEADAVFTPARLEAQRLQILDRLEHIGHPARVIQFPGRNGRNLSIFTGSQVRRWIAAAAAAGLVVGVTVGRLSDYNPPRAVANRAAVQVVRGATIPPSGHSAVRTSDEDLLLKMDQPIYQPVDELEALDAITPHPVSVAMTLR